MFSLATEHKLTGELTEVPLKHQCVARISPVTASTAQC